MTHAPPQVLTVAEAATEYRLGRNRTLRLVATGELPALRAGRRILIPRIALDTYISRALEGHATELRPCAISDGPTP